MQLNIKLSLPLTTTQGVTEFSGHLTNRWNNPMSGSLWRTMLLQYCNQVQMVKEISHT